MSANSELRETTVKLRNLTAALGKFWGFQMSSSILSKNLEILNVLYCQSLTRLPDNIGDMKSLRDLNVSWCNQIHVSALPDRYDVFILL